MSTPIAVAVSGGMDSLLTLALLAEQGESVLAVHGRFLEPSPSDLEREQELEQQCRALGAEFLCADLREEFAAQVVQPFARAYAAGATPNPCALCNPRVKFGLLLDAAARAHGVERLATGHYARIQRSEDGPALYKGLDPVKEQSYFLSLVPRERLARAVFPLGGMRKAQVPAELAKRSLTPPLAQESQEICFIPDDDYRAFLERSGEPLPGPGPVVTEQGEVLGEHQGLWRHTLGQRRGLGIAHAEPLYVLAKDVAANTLIVGGRDRLLRERCAARDVNVLADPETWPKEVLARTRYRQHAKPALAELADNELRITFLEPQSLPTPGQVAVLYAPDGRVLAAGSICA